MAVPIYYLILPCIYFLRAKKLVKRNQFKITETSILIAKSIAAKKNSKRYSASQYEYMSA